MEYIRNLEPKSFPLIQGTLNLFINNFYLKYLLVSAWVFFCISALLLLATSPYVTPFQRDDRSRHSKHQPTPDTPRSGKIPQTAAAILDLNWDSQNQTTGSSVLEACFLQVVLTPRCCLQEQGDGNFLTIIFICFMMTCPQSMFCWLVSSFTKKWHLLL